jgi:hydroxyquinol 1,2-dioxygenase
MRNIDEHSITDAVVARLGHGPQPRFNEVMAALVAHLHDFVRDVNLTEAEWEQGIAFLTDTGHACSGQRQEFILLSDVLGVSMLTVALNHKRAAGATEATVFGPFHVDDAPRCEDGADIARGAPGAPLFARIEVVDLQERPIEGAEVGTWQADDDGLYDVQRPELGAQRRARGVFRTDAKGCMRFRSIVPTAYPVPTDGPVGRLLDAAGAHAWRPAHVHLRIRAEGHATLITHLFREPDRYLDSDVVFGVRSSLVARFEEHAAGSGPMAAQVQGAYFTLEHRVVLAAA